MKKKIIILGSTGSIGQNTLKILRKNKKDFEIALLSTNLNINRIHKQAKEFKVKNLIINNYQKYIEAKKKFKKSKINIFHSFKSMNRIIRRKKIFYSMVSVSGIDGLNPTLQLSKISENLAIVNKESIICGWTLIEKNLKKYKTNFIPIDSEHFSIFSLLGNDDKRNIDRVYLTASGGPFIDFPKYKFKKIKVKEALKHPNWNMGKKISIDSATLMNKVFEVIEAKNIFNLSYNKIIILTHPKSYIHAIVKFNNGLIKFLAHETDMKIPIYNSIYYNNLKKIKTKALNIDSLNNLKLKKVDLKKFPLVKLLKKLPNKTSLFETILVTINDYLVFKFLNKKINFQELIDLIIKISNFKEFQKFKKIKPKNVDDIYRLRDYVSLKLDRLDI